MQPPAALARSSRGTTRCWPRGEKTQCGRAAKPCRAAHNRDYTHTHLTHTSQLRGAPGPRAGKWRRGALRARGALRRCEGRPAPGREAAAPLALPGHGSGREGEGKEKEKDGREREGREGKGPPPAAATPGGAGERRGPAAPARASRPV